ncbi:dephospho-CoA kinase [Neisseria sp. Ec49-e6-T10]|uniref:dephospho-CoA kinase n=1 Tax=Neisseria sp. Ec49-e6-T10 TaxID=3140744 RepID=UPI003EBE78AA
MYSFKTPFVGLTGGIGSGKTAVSDFFQELGVPVVDTDEISRQLSQTEPFLSQVRLAFGDCVFQENGQIDRAILRQIVFADQVYKKKLEKIAHPMIKTEAIRQISGINALYGILVVPLLFETGNFLSLVKRVLVVDCDENIQIQRVMARSQLTETQVCAIMAQQASREARLKKANDVIENNSDQDILKASVKQLHQFYLNYFEQEKGRIF